MALPLIFIGIAAITGVAGVSSTAVAGVNQTKANKLNLSAEQRVENAANRLDYLRHQCGTALTNLADEKIFVLEGNIKSFVDTFEKIKNVDFTESVGLSELNKMHIDKQELSELKQMSNFAVSLSQGTVAGIAGGAMTAFGAYSAATTFATASTGTAISTLSGAAATNATLAFFGGGSLASGGLGIAGGTAVLGGLVAGPALLVMGLITGAKAGKNLENAKANMAQAEEACEQFKAGAEMCIAIRRRTSMFYNLLARLDSRLLPLIHEMERIVEEEGYDYSTYKLESKKTIAACVSTAVSVKAVLDTAILTSDGAVTEESKTLVDKLCIN